MAKKHFNMLKNYPILLVKDEMKELSWKPIDEIGKYMEVFIKRYVCNALAFPFEREIPIDVVNDFKKIFERKGTPEDNFWESVKKSKNSSFIRSG